MNIFLSYFITNINNKFRKKWFKISRGWKYFEAESFLRLKVSRGRNCLRAESVSQLFSGPQVSQGWKCLLAESFSEPQVSQGWNCRNWKCLRAESVFHPHGWKCLAAENVWAANFLQWKLSQGRKCLLDCLPILTHFYLLRTQNCFVMIFRTILGSLQVKTGANG